MNSDAEEVPAEIGYALIEGDFERAKAWLAGGSATAPRSVNDVDQNGWTLLHWTAASDAMTPEHVEFARYLISRGAVLDVQTSSTRRTALHFACESITNESAAAVVSALVAAGANVTLQTRDGLTPLFMIKEASEWTLHIVTTLLRAGASLDHEDRGSIWSFEGHLYSIYRDHMEQRVHVGAIRNLVASVRAAGSWKAHCRRPHKQILRLRSLVARGRTRERLATTRAIRFIVRQGDNGIVWHILSYWRETG